MGKIIRGIDTALCRGIASAAVMRLGGRIVVSIVIMVALAAAAGVATLLLVRSHQAPAPLALGNAPTPGSVSGLAGKWAVGPGSQVGYRVKEQFINQPAETEAVARTSKVTGSVVVAVDGGTVRVTQIRFTADLGSLVSQDKYASYQAFQRDFFVRTIYLQTDTFPTATFTAQALSFPPPANGPINVDVAGKLSVHGATKNVTAHLQAVGAGSQAEVAGSMDVDMRDFGIEPPDISFTRSEPKVTIELDLKLVHA